MIMCNIVKISLSVEKIPSFLLVQRNQNFQDFTAIFVKRYKIREHGGFSQSRSHIYKKLKI